ncbi:4-hydroxy-tetrahydrodipicolinate synthase [Halomarina salina]|uniref:4-hydroxy-tetrahydrodipicolinate synthase n=1 Tax=Halomarina salina TaxID=1872699 RepID=A0ABD5RJ65_9EURY|nr:4-hydroxy-tetrahydrodipicolinate synthase [Halomarina salina]
MTHQPYAGVYPALPTPFHDDDSIDHETLADHARRMEDAGVAGVVPVGTTGESATLTHDEHVAVVETVADAVTVPVVAGAGSNATHEALELAQRSVDAGADGLLLISPYYNNPEPAGMEEHFRAVADTLDVPQVIYNVPSRTGRNIAVETAVSLASHPNVVGYKAASGDLGRSGEILERTQDEAFSVLSGEDGLNLPLMSMGATGCISVTANVEPERTVAMVDAALEDEFVAARQYHYDLGPLSRALFLETNPIPLKAALSMREDYPERLRSPLSRLSERHRDELREALTGLEGDEEEPTQPPEADV